MARIKLGLASELRLGNLEARPDWDTLVITSAQMHFMLQQPAPDDYVVATGEPHTVATCQRAFAEVDLDYQDYVVIDERFYRPAETEALVGDAAKAKES